MPFKFNKKSLFVSVLIVLAVSIEPLLHHWLDRYETEGTVSTGIHTADSAINLHAMDMLNNGFYSPYATPKAPNGTHVNAPNRALCNSTVFILARNAVCPHAIGIV